MSNEKYPIRYERSNKENAITVVCYDPKLDSERSFDVVAEDFDFDCRTDRPNQVYCRLQDTSTILMSFKLVHNRHRERWFFLNNLMDEPICSQHSPRELVKLFIHGVRQNVFRSDRLAVSPPSSCL